MSSRTLFLLGAGMSAVLAASAVALADPEPITPCAEEPQNLNVAYGDKASCEITPATDTDVYRFPGVEGERVGIAIAKAGGGNVCIDLRDPNGVRIDEVRCSTVDRFGNGSYSARIEADLTSTGTHSVIVSEAGNDGTVPYVVSIDRVSPIPAQAASICSGCSTAEMISPLSDVDYFFFSGEVGSIVNLLAARTSGGNICLELRRPDGTIKNAVTCSTIDRFGNGSNSAGFEPTLDATGVHLAILSASGGASTVNYNLTLQCLIGDCVGPPLCNGVPASIWGTDGDNVLIGTEERDIIAGRGGNDVIYGLGGDDLICGDAGSDTIFGGDGFDRILGGGGSDLLFGEGGKDRLIGSGGNDVLSGGDDDDVLNGGSGADVCDGGSHVSADTASSCEALQNVP